MVQLANVVDVQEGVSPQSLNHFNRLRAVTITAVSRRATRSATRSRPWTRPPSACCRRLRRPTSTASRASSAARAAAIYLTFVLALVFIYLVLSAQFESFADPFVIMLSVPLSMTGALLALWLTRRHAQHLQPDRA